MTRRSKKFAVPLNTSVSKEMFDRAQKLQQDWDRVSLEKFDKRFRMSDLAEIVWSIGLTVLEEIPKPTILDTIAKEKISQDVLKVEVRKARKTLKAPKILSNMTDEQIEDMTRSSGPVSEE